MNLLERMAEALRRAMQQWDTDDHCEDVETRNVLAEFERDQERLVLLKFEDADRYLQEVGTHYVVLDKAGNSPCMLSTVNPFLDYAYAVLPKMPGQEVFKNEEQS